MNILVTGDMGFIGSFLVKKLEKIGYNVSGLNTSNGDICDLDSVKQAVKNMDIVFHLAGESRPLVANEKPDLAYSSIYQGTANVIMACREIGAKVVFASSHLVYGDTVGSIPETIPLRPLGVYSIYKMLAEKLCNPNDFIVRLGAVYGPSERCHSVVTRFIQWIKARMDIPMFQNADVTRDFIFIDDVIDALILGLDHSGVYNVGTGVETSMKNLLDTISKVLNIEYTTVDINRKIDQVNRVCLDISKIKTDLGWEPKVNLEEGISRCKDV